MSSNPYQLRFEVLAMAKDIVSEAYHSQRDNLINEYHAKLETTPEDQRSKLVYPVLPSYPSEQVILEKAKQLYTFVLDDSK